MVNESRLFDLESDLVCFHCGKCCSASFIRIIMSSEAVSLFSFCSSDKVLYDKVNMIPVSDGSTSLYLNRGETCPFYDQDQRLCLVYAIRPTCCRAYPVHSLDCARGSIISSVECPGFLIALSKYFDIPFQLPEV